MPIDVKALVASLKTQLEVTKQKIADNDGWDMGDVVDVFQALVLVMSMVELQASQLGTMTSDEKKAVAVETLNWLVDVPLVPEWLEAKFFNVAVDLLVIGLNKWVGQDWLAKVGIDLPT